MDTAATLQIGIPEGRATISMDEAASLCNVSTRTIGNWIKEGRLHAVKMQRRVLIPVPSFVKFLGLNESAEPVSA